MLIVTQVVNSTAMSPRRDLSVHLKRGLIRHFMRTLSWMAPSRAAVEIMQYVLRPSLPVTADCRRSWWLEVFSVEISPTHFHSIRWVITFLVYASDGYSNSDKDARSWLGDVPNENGFNHVRHSIYNHRCYGIISDAKYIRAGQQQLGNSRVSSVLFNYLQHFACAFSLPSLRTCKLSS